MADVAAPERRPDIMEPWTFEDLLALPESLWRYEIVDGGLLMTPPPGMWHEAVSDDLRAILRASLPAELRVLGPIGVDIHPTYLIPDLAVIRKDAVHPDRDRAKPADLLLVVEVVSPGPQSADRILKPAKYAAAGIPHVWRLETRPGLSLTAYALGSGATAYTEVGTWKDGQTARLTRPFPVDIPIGDLGSERPG